MVTLRMTMTSEKKPDFTMEDMIRRIEAHDHDADHDRDEMVDRGDGYIVDVVEGYEKECLQELRERQKKGLRP